MEMKTIYQPEIKKYAEEIISDLKEADFFVENEIENFEFVNDYWCNFLTQKFITSGLNPEEGLFTEDEFDTILKELVVGNLLYSLKEKGYLNSYEDDNTEETFFLTEKGKEFVKTQNSE